AAIGQEGLGFDRSCRGRENDYWVVTDRWQKFTEFKIDQSGLSRLAAFCSEFLVHAVDVEGLCGGVDLDLVDKLARWSPVRTTYAGGARSMIDLDEVTRVSNGRIDLTIRSALDIFGGIGLRYAEVVEFNRKLAKGQLK